eukprot:351934-Chlamydomonas_euryale.AAC.2
MNHPKVVAKGLLLAGQTLLYKFMAAAPPQEHPWPEQLEARLRVLRRRRRRRFREKLGIKLGDDATVAGGSAKPAVVPEGSELPDAQIDKSDAIAVASDGAVGETDASRCSMPADAEAVDWDPPLDDSERAELEQAVSASRCLQQEAEDTLLQALRYAMGRRDWPGAEAAALALACCHGRQRPGLAARYLSLAGSAKACKHGRALLLAAMPLQQPEALMLKQADVIADAVPMHEDSAHYAQVRVKWEHTTKRLLCGSAYVTAGVWLS